MKSFIALVLFFAVCAVAAGQQVCPPNCPCKNFVSDDNVGGGSVQYVSDVAAVPSCKPVGDLPRACTQVNSTETIPMNSTQTVTFGQAVPITYQAAPVYQDAPVFLGTFFDDGSGNLVAMDGEQAVAGGRVSAFGGGSFRAAVQNGRAAYHSTRAAQLSNSAAINMSNAYGGYPMSNGVYGSSSRCPGGRCPGGNCPR